MKKLLGYVLISTPFILVYVGAIIVHGFKKGSIGYLVGLGTTGLIMGVIFLGWVFIDSEK